MLKIKNIERSFKYKIWYIIEYILDFDPYSMEIKTLINELNIDRDYYLLFSETMYTNKGKMFVPERFNQINGYL